MSNEQNNYFETVSIASSMSQEEDEQYLNFDQIIQSGKLQDFSKKQDQINQYTKFLGVNFLTKNLQERNKDPIILLWAFFVTISMQISFSFFTFVYGSNFYILYCIVQPTIGLGQIFTTYKILNLSISELRNAPIQLKVLLRIVPFSNISMFLIGFLKNTPFQKQSLYILCLFFVIFFAALYVGMLVNENETPWNQKNYQMDFFFNRFMFAFIGSTGLIDVLSDIVLGINCIYKFKLIYIIFGVFLIIFCGFDLLVLVTRIVTPHLITLKIQIFTTVWEVLILGMSVGVVFLVQYFEKNEIKDNNEEVFEVALISIASTVINLVHHVTLIIVQMMSQNETKIENISRSKQSSQKSVFSQNSQ